MEELRLHYLIIAGRFDSGGEGTEVIEEDGAAIGKERRRWPSPAKRDGWDGVRSAPDRDRRTRIHHKQYQHGDINILI